VFIEAKDDGGGGDNWTTGAVSRVKLQSNCHHQQTNIQFFSGRMPFLSPKQQCQSTEGKISHSMDLLTPSSPGGLPTLFLDHNSSWLPLGRLAMPLISPLMPVPRSRAYKIPNIYVEIGKGFAPAKFLPFWGRVPTKEWHSSGHQPHSHKNFPVPTPSHQL